MFLIQHRSFGIDSSVVVVEICESKIVITNVSARKPIVWSNCRETIYALVRSDVSGLLVQHRLYFSNRGRLRN